MDMRYGNTERDFRESRTKHVRDSKTNNNYKQSETGQRGKSKAEEKILVNKEDVR
jgi:hypothetical protein